MNRLKLLAAAALLAVPLINACGEDIAPTPIGSIAGQVVVEGEQQAGVTVTLSTGTTAITTSTGTFGFNDVKAGTHTLTISGYTEDASFVGKETATATIATNGEKVTVDFSGDWIRTSSVTGEVTVEGTGLPGVVVKLTGVSEAEATTGTTGAYSFTGLRAGVHTVEISGFDEDDIGFSATSSVVEVAVGETGELDFQAAYLRASAIEGRVTVEGEGLAGVTVSLQDPQDGRNLEVGTNSGGNFSFTSLRKGDYTLAISGYDTDEYEFDVTSQTVTVARAETGEALFDGIALRTATITGAVKIGGDGLEGVTVSLAGGKEGESFSMVTNATGQWSFTRLHAGAYTVAISGYDTDEYGFDVTSQTVTVALKETATADFDGIKLRTAAISGQVSIEGDPLAGVTVTVNGKGETHVATTDVAGDYAVDRLHAGDYTVTISGFDTDEYDFDPTVKSVSVGLRETAPISFSGIMLRTVQMTGTVTTDGEPLGGVTVTVSGGRADETETRVTDADGGYSLDRLHAGDYTVTVSSFDTDEYEFDPTQKSVKVELREKADVSFPGVKLRTVEMTGTVTTDGEALAGVTVTVSGGRADEEVEATTDAKGTYSLDRLHAGDYTVTVSGFDADEYEFDPVQKSVEVALREEAEVSFPGVKLRTVEIVGTVTTDGEALAGVTVTVSGGRFDEEVEAVTDAEGAYSLERLHAGDYTVTVSGFETDEYEFVPAQKSVTVALRGKADVSFPGVKLRTAEIFGTVKTRDGPLGDVTVTVSGGRAEETKTTATDGDGGYSIGRLHAGDYEVAISGYDPEEFEFDPAQKSVTVALQDEAKVSFDNGVPLRTASISGRVTWEGEDKSGITVTLSGAHKAEMETNATGQYNFPGLPAGDYEVTVSGYDTIEHEYTPGSVDVTLMLDAAEIVNFAGRSLRTVVITGSVTAEDEMIAGARVSLWEVKSFTEIVPVPGVGSQTTDEEGGFTFDGLLGKWYAVWLTGFDEEYAFPTIPLAGQQIVAWTDNVATDDTATADFTGKIIRTAKIGGEVEAGGEPIEDVQVTIKGDHAPAKNTMMTDADGMYMFDGLRKGDYEISVVNPDTAMYAFPTTALDITVAVGQVQDDISFAGSVRNTASISGRITLDGGPVKDITVTLSGRQKGETKTDADGQYNFPGLLAGNYTLKLSGFDTEEYEYTPDSLDVTLTQGEGKIQPFAGRSLRTVVIMGSVTAEGEMIAGAKASLHRVISETEIVSVPGGSQLTDSMGEFTFDGLLDDIYAVLITGFDKEYDFPKIEVGGQLHVAWTDTVATDDTATASFVGTIIKTAKIGGEVMADGEPVDSVQVMIEGDHADDTTMTDADGKYMFDRLRKGDYTISIANPDTDMYEFQTTESEVTVSVGQVQDDVSFAGSILRAANIEGKVDVEGDALPGVVVTVEADDGETMTDTTGAQGRYNVRGLGAGDYTVSIANPDTAVYAFDTTEYAVDGLGSAERRIVDFGGDYVNKASVSGMLFLDVLDKDGEKEEGEPFFEGKAATNAKLTLMDADSNMWSMAADTNGAYAFKGLTAGTYTLMHDKTSDAALGAAGYAFAGDTAGVTVTLTGTTKATIDLPYDITKQTINIWALMGKRDTVTTTGVAGVSFDVYPTLLAAQQEDAKLKLGAGKTGTKGWAAVTFDRADDGDGTVFVNINGKSTHHKDLVVLDDLVEVKYASTERTTDAMDEAVRLYNTRSNFQWKVMSAARQVGGTALGGWKANVTGGLVSHLNVTTAKNGSAKLSEDFIPYAKLPLKYTIKLDKTQHDSVTGEEVWESKSVSYTHTGLDLPKTAPNSAGTISVNWTTQSLYLGFYREVDGKVGFTKEWSGDNKGDVPLDHRPIGTHIETVKWTFRALNSETGRYEEFKWDHDGDSKTDPVDANKGAKWDTKKSWLVRFPMIPTTTRLEITLDIIGTGKSLYAGPTLVDADNVTSKDVRNINGVYNTFGANGGGHPEMWLCGESSGTITPANARSDEHDGCVTYGYQWANNIVQGDYRAKIRTTGGYDRSLDTFMIATLKGISATADEDIDSAAYYTKGSYSWNNLNDGLYTLKTKKTTRYRLDKAGESYKGTPLSFTSVTDAAGYLDTLFVFYKEEIGDGRPEGAYNRRTRFQVTDLDPKLGDDATLETLTYKIGTATTKTVPGFKKADKGGKTYELTVGWDVDSITLEATTNDSLAKVSGAGKKKLGRAGKTSSFVITGTSEDKKKTATYTVAVFRTKDRFKLTDADGDLIDLDELKVNEYDTSPLKLGLTLWAKPDIGQTVNVASVVGGSDNPLLRLYNDSDSVWADTTYFGGDVDFTRTNYNTRQVMKVLHPDEGGAEFGTGDRDGENGADTIIIVGDWITANEVDVTDTLELIVTFVDKDSMQFVHPTKIRAIEGATTTQDSAFARTPVHTTLGTMPTGDVSLDIDVGRGGSATTPGSISRNGWENGVTYYVAGDEGGSDFEIEVDPDGGGYDDVVHPDIEVEWISEYSSGLWVLTPAAKLFPGRRYDARVALVNSDLLDKDNANVLDDRVEFLTGDDNLECPAGWTCAYSETHLDTSTRALDVQVTASDTAKDGDYWVKFWVKESDKTRSNGYLIDSVLDDEEEEGDEIERKDSIKFTVVKLRK